MWNECNVNATDMSRLETKKTKNTKTQEYDKSKQISCNSRPHIKGTHYHLPLRTGIWPLQNIQASSVGNSGGLFALFERAFCGQKSETNLKSPLNGRSQLPRHTGLIQSSSYWPRPISMMIYILKIVALQDYEHIHKYPARSDVM